MTDAGGNFIWVNRGPATDFAWIASTPFTAAATVIVDSNGYKETPYRAGKSAAVTHPVWSTVLNAQVVENTTLTWLNAGGYTAATSFNFSVRNASIDVAYLPLLAENTRAATTDEITLPLTQSLGLVQLRYGLTNGGEMQVAEVWVEASSG